MTHWRVYGADGRTGEEKMILVVGDDEAAARDRAWSRGLFVSRLEPADRAETAKPAQPLVAAGTTICPICHRHIVPALVQTGSAVLCAVLLLLWILPGVLYAIFSFKKYWACPHCHAKLADC